MDIITFFDRDFDVTENKCIFCSYITILYRTFLKPVLMFSSYYVDNFERRLM